MKARETATRQGRYQSANPQKVWAWACLRSAIRRGLVKRQPCEVCGSEPADGHHEDYDRPADVRWLCRRHHRELHARAGKAGG